MIRSVKQGAYEIVKAALRDGESPRDVNLALREAWIEEHRDRFRRAKKDADKWFKTRHVS